jgi:NapC/NirT cytochrome c family, N-terminal region
MDTANFCGTTGHVVMQPEYTTYQNSPHSRVACVDCHIGPGAGWFVRSKVSGLRQVFAVTFHTYPRPIPSPVENLRPARAYL